jgi:hypothetical protein
MWARQMGYAVRAQSPPHHVPLLGQSEETPSTTIVGNLSTSCIASYLAREQIMKCCEEIVILICLQM